MLPSILHQNWESPNFHGHLHPQSKLPEFPARATETTQVSAAPVVSAETNLHVVENLVVCLLRFAGSVVQSPPVHMSPVSFHAGTLKQDDTGLVDLAL